MNLRKFKGILRKITFMDYNPPVYKYFFWEVRQLIDHCKNIMAGIFNLSWVIFLEYSMIIWFTRWNFPGWILVTRKTYPFGKKFHTISFDKCEILYDMEIVDVKDNFKELPEAPTNTTVKKNGIIIFPKKLINSKGRVEMLYISFFILQGIIEIRKVRIFESEVTKKHCYRPRHVPSQEIYNYKKTK